MIYFSASLPVTDPIGFPFIPGSWTPAPHCQIGIHPTITSRIDRALPKLGHHEPLNFDESEALAIVWHQLLHTRGDQDFSDYESDVRRRFEIELVNEIHARLTLDAFIADLGFDPSLVAVQAVERLGRHYGDWVLPVIRILETIGVSREEARSFFEYLNYQQSTMTYLNAFLQLIGDRLNLNALEQRDLRRLIEAELRHGHDLSSISYRLRINN